jgi:hypothetical protein
MQSFAMSLDISTAGQFKPPTAATYSETGTFICLNTPPRSEFGIDMCVWTVGEKFQGIKFIPPGMHLVYYSSAPESTRSAAFLHCTAGQVIVAKWNPSTEQIVLPEMDGEVNEETADRISAAVKRMEFDACLGPYPMGHYSTWQALATCVSKPLVDRIQPIGGQFHQSAAAAGEETTPKDATRLYFSHVPGVGAHAKPEHRTQYAIDPSFALREIVCRFPRESDKISAFVGEMQAAYVLFVMGQSLEALEAWKHMADVLCRSEECICAAACSPEDTFLEPSPQFFEQALGAFASQLANLPPDLLMTDLSADSFLKTSLEALYRTSLLIQYSDSLRDATGKVLHIATSRLQMKFETSPPLVTHVLPGESVGYSSVEAMLAALRYEGGDDDLPTFAEG